MTKHLLFFLAAAMLAGSQAVFCADKTPEPGDDPDTIKVTRPQVRAMAIETPPTLDGRLSESAWRQAEDGGPLIEYAPREGAEPAQRTEFRILYTPDALYIGVWCLEEDPSRIIAREMARDGRITMDDYIIFVLDTFLDGRNGYYFMINPNGAREDALISNNGRPNDDWNGIWSCRTSIQKDGWQVEIEIPFKTLSFDPKLDTWGFNLARRVKRNMEGHRWSGAHPEYHTHYLSEAGRLTGLKDLQQGIGLDIVPYAMGRQRYDHSERDHDYRLEAGGDMRYRITPNLTASLSYNTDFAETEVDSRRINLTRFPLFFPEKRAFFLEDNGIFEFGDLGTELIPFFSRRIGLSSDGEVVPLLAAGKLTGRINNFNIGVLDALIDDHAGLAEKNLFATRISRNVFEKSAVGIIGTVGNPDSDDENMMGGVDYCYHTSKLFGDQLFEWNSFALASHTEHTPGKDNMAFGTEIVLPNDFYYARAQAYQIDPNFDAALGFVPRTDIRAYESSFSLRPRPESIKAIRQLFFMYSNHHVTDLSNRLDTAHHKVTPLSILFESGDELYFSYYRSFDAPDDDFEISDGVVVPRGRYWWNAYRVGFETASKRVCEMEGDIRFGEFYRGRRLNCDLSLNLRLSRHFFWAVGYDYNDIDLPEGNFDTHLGSMRAQVNFTPDLIWYNLVQYDNVSEKMGFNSRIAWEYTPGAYIYLVLNQNVNARDDRFAIDSNQLTVKVNYTLRF